MSCNMVYVLPTKYAKPDNAQACQAVETEGVEDKVLTPTPANPQAVEQEEVLDAEEEGLGQFMSFKKPTPSMVTHMRPLYITADMQGTKVSKVMVDTGAAVNMITLHDSVGHKEDSYPAYIFNSEEFRWYCY